MSAFDPKRTLADLVTGAKRVMIAMQHTAKGKPKVMNKCTLPLTSARTVDLRMGWSRRAGSSASMRLNPTVVTELVVIGFPGGCATLIETGPGVSVEQVVAATEAKLVLPEKIPPMQI